MEGEEKESSVELNPAKTKRKKASSRRRKVRSMHPKKNPASRMNGFRSWLSTTNRASDRLPRVG